MAPTDMGMGSGEVQSHFQGTSLGQGVRLSDLVKSEWSEKQCLI